MVLQRKQLEDHGLDFGPEEVAAALVGVVDSPPSPATVYRMLKARGLITAEPRKAPTRSHRRFNAARANESWQLDDMGWELADGTEVKILNIVDDHSRLLVGSTAMAVCTGAAALAAVAEAAATLGWPERFQSDNANTFRGVLANALRPLGVAAAHSRPSHPQTNGKVERFHQTAQKWLGPMDRSKRSPSSKHCSTSTGTTTTTTVATAGSAAASPPRSGQPRPKQDPPIGHSDHQPPSTTPASHAAASP